MRASRGLSDLTAPERDAHSRPEAQRLVHSDDDVVVAGADGKESHMSFFYIFYVVAKCHATALGKPLVNRLSPSSFVEVSTECLGWHSGNGP